MTAFTMTLLLAQADVVAQSNNDDIAEADRKAAIRAALEHYSRDFPRVYSDDYTGDGGRYYPLNSTALTGWSEDFSQVARIEYPATTVADDETPQYLEREDWRDDYFVEESDARVRYLLLFRHAPASTEAMRVTYTVPYTFTGSGASEATDIPGQHFYAFSNLAGYYLCRAIASKYSKIGDSTLDVDSASHTTKAQEYSIRARELLKAYRDQMSLPDPDVSGQEAAAGVFLRFEATPDSPGGRRFLFHGRRR